MRWLTIFLLLTPVPASAQDMAGGELSYKIHCAGCHGLDATGDVGAAQLMERPPPDLTTLAKRNGGTFPRALVVYQIDGRAPASSAHWDKMPNFGDLLEGETVFLKTAAGQPIQTTAAIAELVDWLEARQE